jgi:hypothetical protein
MASPGVKANLAPGQLAKGGYFYSAWLNRSNVFYPRFFEIWALRHKAQGKTPVFLLVFSRNTLDMS